MSIARAYVPQGSGQVGGGIVNASHTPGCVVTGQGVAGFVQVTLAGAPDAVFRDSNLIIKVSPSPGSNIAGGIEFGLSSIDNAGNFGIAAYRQDTGAAVDVPYAFSVDLVNGSNAVAK